MNPTMSPTPRSRVWNLLRTAWRVGHTGVTVATLAGVLDTTPEEILSAVLVDMLHTPEGCEAPPIYCAPSPEGPTLTPRRFPEG